MLAANAELYGLSGSLGGTAAAATASYGYGGGAKGAKGKLRAGGYESADTTGGRKGGCMRACECARGVCV